LIVPISDAFAPPATRALPFAISGGQKVAHCPEHALFPFSVLAEQVERVPA
jgi:hypothetical protein